MRSLLPGFIVSVLGLFLGHADPARAVVLFEFDYGTSLEFLDPAAGGERRAALEDAARSLGALFENDATVQLMVTSSNDPNGATLASAFSADLEVPDDFVGFSPGVVQRKILTGTDGNEQEADGEVDVNFGQPWDLDDDVSVDLFDFKATIIHELVHAVGFSSLIYEDGTDIFDTPPGDPGVWAPFDEFLTGPDGVAIIDGNYALNQSAWETLSVGGASPDNGLFFNGPKARAANGGQPVGLYSPVVWEEGSSGSHLDDDNPAYADMMMLAFTDPGPYTRELSGLETAILTDLGYDMAGIEPNAAPQLTIQRAASAVSLTVSGSPGAYAIRRSIDLETWEIIATVTITNPAGAASIDVDPSGSGGRAYFTAAPE